MPCAEFLAASATSAFQKLLVKLKIAGVRGRGQCPAAFSLGLLRRHAARDTRSSTRRSRRQASIRTV